jgi:hypothetical protein
VSRTSEVGGGRRTSEAGHRQSEVGHRQSEVGYTSGPAVTPITVVQTGPYAGTVVGGLAATESHHGPFRAMQKEQPHVVPKETLDLGPKLR